MPKTIFVALILWVIYAICRIGICRIAGCGGQAHLWL